jgi:hypothetical protein
MNLKCLYTAYVIFALKRRVFVIVVKVNVLKLCDTREESKERAKHECLLLKKTFCPFQNACHFILTLWVFAQY